MEGKSKLQVAALIINNEVFPIYGGVNTIGRDKDAIVNIKHVNISKYHAIIFVLENQHYISDLNSSNGCTAESSQMVPFQIYQLKNNSQVTIGGLDGIYLSEAPFPDKNDFSRKNLPTQSFYECNTQLLDNSVTQNIHEAATQEISWAWVKPKQVLAQKEGISNKVTMEEDEETDCEDNIEEIAPNNVAKHDENSNDSLDFLKQDKESDTEDFNSRRTKKSLMVISTQDIGSDSLLEAEKKPSYEGINDTIPATQNESAIQFNESDIIPSTQDAYKHLKKSSGWSEESFKLGLTELMEESPREDNNQKICVEDQKDNNEVTTDLTTAQHSPGNSNQNEEIYNVKSIEELGQPRGSEPETENIVDAKALHDREEDSHDLSAQKVGNFNSETENIFNASTQKVDDPETQSIFNVPTQKVDIQGTVEDNIYDLATQKISYHFEENEIALLAPVDDRTIKSDSSPTSKVEFQESTRNEQDDIYDLATQKISRHFDNPEPETTFKVPTQKVDEEENIYDLATQKINYYFEENETTSVGQVDNAESETTFNVPTQKVSQEESIYDVATQKINKDILSTDADFDAPTQRVEIMEPPDDQDKDIYDLPTQKVTNNLNIIPVNTSQTLSVVTNASETEIYELATQKVDDVKTTKEQPQSIDTSVSERTGIHEEVQLEQPNEIVDSSMKIQKPKKESKKKFSFKKKQCNLDASLSTLTDNKPSKPKTGPASNSHNDSNKSFARLESKCTKTKKSKDTSEIQVTVPKGRRTMTLSLRDDSALTSSNTRSRANKKSNVLQETVPKEVVSANSRKRRGGVQSVTQNEAPVRKSSRHSSKTESINNNNNKIEAGKRRASSSSSSCTSTTPQKKQKIEITEASVSTPQRGLRKQKPKVVFTMLDNPRLESLIKQLGGSIVESVEACTVLVTEHVKRSQKLLSAIGFGRPICSPKWITESKKNQEFLDPWDYLLTDPEAEKKWDFSLEESLHRSRADKLLDSYNFYIQITNGADVLKGAIESCGGKWLSKLPTPPPENTYIISSPDNRSKYSRITKKYPDVKVLEGEAIFDGVLRQELRFSRHTIG